MDEAKRTDREAGVIEGADDAAVAATPPASAPPGAAVDASERLVPGADAELAEGRTSSRPWATSLAARDPQAGVANDDPAAVPDDPLFDEEHGR